MNTETLFVMFLIGAAFGATVVWISAPRCKVWTKCKPIIELTSTTEELSRRVKRMESSVNNLISVLDPENPNQK